MLGLLFLDIVSFSFCFCLSALLSPISTLRPLCSTIGFANPYQYEASYLPEQQDYKTEHTGNVSSVESLNPSGSSKAATRQV